MSEAQQAHNCDKCKRSFSNPIALRQHALSAHAPRDVACNQCGKKFRDANSLKQHARIHTDAKQDRATSSASPLPPVASADLPTPQSPPMMSSEPASKNKRGKRDKRRAKRDIQVTPPAPVLPGDTFDPNYIESPPAVASSSNNTSSPDQVAAQLEQMDLNASNASSSSRNNDAPGNREKARKPRNNRRKAEHVARGTDDTADLDSNEPSASSSAPSIVVDAPAPGRPHEKHPALISVTPSKKGKHAKATGTPSSKNTPSKGSTPARKLDTNRDAPNQATPSKSTPKRQKDTRSPLPRGATPAHYRERINRGRNVYPPHMSLEKAREEVKAGRAWEGTLRANPNASRMCFFSLPGRTRDLMIKDEWLNRAFAGDTVIIQLLDEQDAKAEEKFQERRNSRKNGGNNGQNGAKKDGESDKKDALLTPSKASASSSRSGTPSKRLRSEQLKGVTDSEGESTDDAYSVDLSDENASDTGSELDTIMEGQDAVGEYENGPNAKKEPTEEEIKAEEARREAEEEFLNRTTHAEYSHAKFEGVLEEDRPKSELAKVICITRAHHTNVGFVGQLRRTRAGFELKPLAMQNPIFDVPPPPSQYLDRIPRLDDVMKRKKRRGKKETDDEPQLLFITFFKRWEIGSRRPLGTEPQFIGESGDVVSESRAITSTHNIDTEPHPESTYLHYGTEKTITLTEEMLATRKDLRQSRIFTVDPPTARDIDDAISIERIGTDSNGKPTFRVGVHIADVSHYVTPGTELDGIAKDRSTSVYMVNTMYPMLPGVLSENLCSLNPKVDRLAFSVMWDMDFEGNIIGNQWIGRTIVRSCAKLSYIDAQLAIESQAAGDLTPAIEHLASLNPEKPAADIADDILNFNMLAQAMRARRFKGGALKLSRLRLSFDLGPDGYPISAQPYYIKESNQLIEEFMLQANMSVAKFLYDHFPDHAMCRSHPAPKEDMLESFSYLMKALGIPFDTSSSGALYRSLTQLEGWQHRPIEELVTRSMNAAMYLSTGTIEGQEELWHYALNVPFYTHFTSPIRRFPDIVVHRQLQLALDKENGTKYTTFDGVVNVNPAADPAWVAEVADHANERKRASRRAQDDSIRLFACLWLNQHPFSDPESIVLDISKTKVTVFSPELCTKVKIDINPRKGVQLKFNTDTRVLSIYSVVNGKSSLILSATYFSKVPITYFTRGKLPMEIAGEFSFWYKHPDPSIQVITAETRDARSNEVHSSDLAASGQYQIPQDHNDD